MVHIHTVCNVGTAYNHGATIAPWYNMTCLQILGGWKSNGKNIHGR